MSSFHLFFCAFTLWNPHQLCNTHSYFTPAKRQTIHSPGATTRLSADSQASSPSILWPYALTAAPERGNKTKETLCPATSSPLLSRGRLVPAGTSTARLLLDKDLKCDTLSGMSWSAALGDFKLHSIPLPREHRVADKRSPRVQPSLCVFFLAEMVKMHVYICKY